MHARRTPSNRLIVWHTLVALNKETGSNGRASAAADVRAFINDPDGASVELVARVSRLPIHDWYRDPSRPDQAERAALWIRVCREFGSDRPGPDPGGWTGDATVLDLGVLANDAGGVVSFKGPEPEAPASAGAEPPLSEPEPTFGGPAVPTHPRPAPRATPPLEAPPLTDMPRSPKEQSDDFVSFEPGAGTGPSTPPRAHGGETPVPRWVQAEAWRADAPAAAANCLAAAQWNLLGVFIGPSIVARTDAPFPDALVDFSQGDVTLTVQLELAGARVVALTTGDLASVLAPDASVPRPAALRQDTAFAQRLLAGPLAKLRAAPVREEAGAAVVELAAGSIVLPRTGDSSLVFFAVCPLPGVTRVTGRIAVIQNNRVLETARVAAGIGPDAAQGDGVVVRAESTIHPRDDDLAARRAYDVAIQVSDVGGRLHLSIQHGDTSTSVQLDDLDAPIKAIRKALDTLAVKWDYAKPALEQPVFAETLYALAGNGSAIEQHLRKKCGDGIDQWERIHLVPVTSEFFPLEYVYAGRPPKFGARPCPNLFGALERGSCDAAMKADGGIAACPNQRDNALVCPMHFWGFRRLIERNGTVRDVTSLSPAAAGRPQVAVPGRQSYGRVRAVLFGASNRTFAYVADKAAQDAERAAVVQAFAELSGPPLDANDWDTWREEVKKHPNLLVLIVHTDERSGTRVLELGSEKFLGYQEILPDLSGATGQPQLLLLLGCSAADVTENFQPYPERFRDAGVSIVLAPIAPIRGAEAVPIAKYIAGRLAKRLAGPEPVTFGELLPQLRRELLLRGHPGVLGLVGFGDGDWQLGGE